MDLTGTIRYLGEQGIEVAIDLGVHQNCDLNSNCPKSVEIRRMIGDMENINLEELLAMEVYQPQNTSIDLSILDTLNTSATMSIGLGNGGTQVEFDWSPWVNDVIRDGVRSRVNNIERVRANLTNTGYAFIDEQKRRIRDTESTRSLTQLNLNTNDMIKYRCMVTTGRNRYLVYMPIRYNPKYIYSDGVTYELTDEDKEAIKGKVPLFLEYSFSASMNQTSNPHVMKFINGELHPFYHYHGVDRDTCWGVVEYEHYWDKEVSSLYRTTRLLENSLVTINKDSLMTRRPTNDMPSADDIMRRARDAARRVEEPVAIQDEDFLDDDWFDEEEPAMTGWGND